MRGACAQVMYGETTTTTMAKCLYSNIINGKIICLCFIEVSCVAHTHTQKCQREKSNKRIVRRRRALYMYILIIYWWCSYIFNIYGCEGGREEVRVDWAQKWLRIEIVVVVVVVRLSARSSCICIRTIWAYIKKNVFDAEDFYCCIAYIELLLLILHIHVLEHFYGYFCITYKININKLLIIFFSLFLLQVMIELYSWIILFLRMII